MLNFKEHLRELIRSALKEDIGEADHSTLCCIPADAEGKAICKIKQDGILAGMEVAKEIFLYKQPSAVFTAFKKYGDVAFELEASVHVILQCERLVLNCMQRMSGIATLTRQYTSKLENYKT